MTLIFAYVNMRGGQEMVLSMIAAVTIDSHLHELSELLGSWAGNNRQTY